MTETTVESRLQRLEDVEAIKVLKADYCFSVDQGDTDRLISLFRHDAVWHAPGIGRYEGKDAIEKFFHSLPDMMRFWLHMVMNPLITVNGAEAQGRWYLLEPNTLKNGTPVWGAARYEERYRRQQGEWLFQEIELLPIFWSPYEDGWEKTRNLFDTDAS
jgi:ketosteroid isomerase-like protein